MKTQRKKHSRLWVYLLYLGLVTSLILSVTLARYASTVEGAGVAAVAAMAGDAAFSGGTIEMPLEDLHPGEAAQPLEFKVVNYSGEVVSEVAMDYQIEIETTGNLPLDFTLTPVPAEGGGTDDMISGGAILRNGAVTETLSGGAFPLTGNKQEHTYRLSAQWPADMSEAGYAYEIDLVTVTVKAQQRLSGEGPSGG